LVRICFSLDFDSFKGERANWSHLIEEEEGEGKMCPLWESLGKAAADVIGLDEKGLKVKDIGWSEAYYRCFSLPQGDVRDRG